MFEPGKTVTGSVQGISYKATGLFMEDMHVMYTRNSLFA